MEAEPMAKDDPLNQEFENRAKNLLKAELKRQGITYSDLAKRLTDMGLQENERNLTNKISRGSFTTAFFLMCMDAINITSLQLPRETTPA
jgi:Domain of unknown function (DUF6471)